MLLKNWKTCAMDNIKWAFRPNFWTLSISFWLIRLINFPLSNWSIIIGKTKFKEKRNRKKERIMRQSKASILEKKVVILMKEVWNLEKVMLEAKVIWQWMKACLITLVLIRCLVAEKTEKVQPEALPPINFKLTETQFMILSIQRWRKLKIYKLFYRKITNCSFWIYAKV